MVLICAKLSKRCFLSLVIGEAHWLGCFCFVMLSAPHIVLFFSTQAANIAKAAAAHRIAAKSALHGLLAPSLATPV